MTVSPEVFEISQLETLITLRPLPKNQKTEVQHGTTKRLLETSNVANVHREIIFSESNRCTDPFKFRYATRSGGYVKPSWEGAENIAESSDIARYEDYGTECFFVFQPNLGTNDKYIFDVEILKGFEEGHRDAHFHLGHNRHYHKLSYTLDLSPYISADYQLIKGPSLYFHPSDLNHHNIEKLRETTSPTKPIEVNHGIWQWELQDIRNGTVDIAWDISDPNHKG